VACAPGNVDNDDSWIGCNDRTAEGRYVWTDGASCAKNAGVYTNFAGGEPNDWQSDGYNEEDCVLM